MATINRLAAIGQDEEIGRPVNMLLLLPPKIATGFQLAAIRSSNSSIPYWACRWRCGALAIHRVAPED